MSLSAGTRLGPYEILAPLGAGGTVAVTRRGIQSCIVTWPSTCFPSRSRTAHAALARFGREAHAVAYTINAIHHGLDLPLADGLALEANFFGVCTSAAGMREGMTAFLEKRPPRSEEK
jgi:enoyl-CoA hydratase/carnithine racemase